MTDEESPFHELVAAVVAAVGDGMNVLVTGPPGAGQVTLAGAVANELSFDRRMVRIVGMQSLQGRSFAALSVLKPARGSDAAAEYRGRPPRRVRYTELLVDATGATGVLFVERPELLDSDSAGVVAIAARHSGVPVVAISGHESPYGASAAFLNDIPPALRLSVPALSLAQIHALTQSMLGAPVEAETVARIAAQSAGLYDMVVGITTVGMRTGALALIDGRWQAVRELVTGDLAGWVEQLGTGIRERQRDVLRRMAAAIALGQHYSVVARERADVGRLMDVGLVKEQGGRLSVHPPLIADYVRSQRQVMERAEVPLAADSSSDAHPALVRTMGRRDSGSDAALSHDIRRHGLAAAQASRAAWLAEPTAARALPLLEALQSTGAEPDVIRAVVEDTAYVPEENYYVLMRIWWATYLGVTIGALDEGVASLQRIEDDAPEWGPLLATARAHLQVATGIDARPIAGELGVGESGVGESSDSSHEDLGLDRVVLLDRLLIGGRSRSALELSASPSDMSHPMFANALTVASHTALIFEGRVAEAIDAARSAMIAAEEAFDLGAIYAHAYVKMLGLFVAGRLDDAHRVLNRVLTLGTARPLYVSYQVGILDLGVVIETLRGESARAMVLAETVVGITGVRPLRGGLPGTSGFSAQRVLVPDDLASRLWSSAAYGAETGQLVTAVFAGVASLFTEFDREKADAVQHWAASADSPLLHLLGRFGVLLDRSAPDALIELADDFLDIGGGLYFARARLEAARAYYERGDRARGFEVASDTWQETEFMGPDRAGLFSELCAEIALTDRESEVAQAGAHIASTRDVAVLLHLSQRTVENYAYSAYRKSGATSREDVAQACEQWLRAPEAHLLGPLL
ncbi:response regulator transcription factor [Gryllotalpicola reticulitermitis]|uniref:Response regulator transcription factor n=1 Tax=Gryllotalpicola reticulitermitis TaxID=1184153 RepID=A0ABV8Q7F0_9MICO